jgi:hypothetical protein
MAINWFELLRRLRPAACVAALLLATSVFAAEKSATAKAKPAAAAAAEDDGKPAPVDPNVIDDLKKMSAYLHTLNEFSLHADTTTDDVIAAGQKVQYGGTVDYKVRRPDRLRIIVDTDRMQRDFYYDGKTVTLYAPLRKFYTTFPAPATIHELVDKLYDDYNMELPISDLFTWGGPKDHTDKLTSAVYIGESTINGTKCGHYAFRQADVDWQLWIASGEKPLPCKMVIVTTGKEEQPQATAVFRWDTAAKAADADFAFAPPKDAAKIGIVSASGDAKK